jgi:hypothetical protein
LNAKAAAGSIVMFGLELGVVIVFGGKVLGVQPAGLDQLLLIAVLVLLGGLFEIN